MLYKKLVSTTERKKGGTPMNKEELLKLLESLELPRKEYYILGGGSLVMFRNKRYYRRFRFVRFRGIV